MRAKHRCDFGEQTGDSNLFCASCRTHRSCCRCPALGSAVPWIWPSHTSRQGPLLMMSFLSRHALKSVMAAKRESVAKCGGPLQYGVGRLDGANTMVKAVQYFAEADPTQALVALDLKTAFQNVSRRAMLHSIEQSDPDLAAVFSRWNTGSIAHRTHFESFHARITANSGVDQGCPPLLPVASQRRLIQFFDLSLQPTDDCQITVPSSSPSLMAGTCTSSPLSQRCYRSGLWWHKINEPSKIQVWRASCLDPGPPRLIARQGQTHTQLPRRTSSHPG